MYFDFLVKTLFISLFFMRFNTCNAVEQLSFSGGGAFGAVEIGILQKIRDMYPVKYDLYTGISAGGLNAGFLSHYTNIDNGIIEIKNMYTTIRNRNVYSLIPETGVSIFNTTPLYNTMTKIIKNIGLDPIIPTYIGAVNLYTGNLDTYLFNENKLLEDKVLLLMSTSAIPILFPPITYKKYMYVDGGTLSNELLDVIHTNEYLNITYISPYGLMEENDTPIETMKEMAMRTIQIITKNYNNPFTRLNHDCEEPRGEINYYFVENKLLENYNMLNFDNGKELIQIGYNNMKYKHYKLC